jgi:hypothetical protein
MDEYALGWEQRKERCLPGALCSSKVKCEALQEGFGFVPVAT